MNNYQENQEMTLATAEYPEQPIQPSQAVRRNTAMHIADMREKYNMAIVYSKAGNIPDAYKGKPADCMVAIDMADRMGISPVMVMQSLYVVKGKPVWSGQACMAFIQANPNFKYAKHVYVGEPGTPDRGCYVSARRTYDDSEVKGVCVTFAMAQAEGWTRNQKWKTITDQMLAYRAAAFFARVHCPAVLMGVAIEGEAEDIENANNLRNSRNPENAERRNIL